MTIASVLDPGSGRKLRSAVVPGDPEGANGAGWRYAIDARCDDALFDERCASGGIDTIHLVEFSGRTSSTVSRRNGPGS